MEERDFRCFKAAFSCRGSLFSETRGISRDGKTRAVTPLIRKTNSKAALKADRHAAGDKVGENNVYTQLASIPAKSLDAYMTKNCGLLWQKSDTLIIVIFYIFL